MNQVFVHDQLIRFSHCDPAAIVYFPRFFDLAHSTMEDWFAQGVGISLPELITERRVGTPTVSIHCDFVKPLRIGDTLRFELCVTRLGNASADLQYRGTRNAEEHLRISQTLVFMDLDAARAVPIPADVRPGIEAYLANPENAMDKTTTSR
ncbi:MAG: thioesterase family protein [Burkholderiales bacterium]|jgi:4-hydroxybenzoyl-CoA thioesterase